MSHFLYYTEHRCPSNRAAIADWRLAHAFDSIPSARQITRGPGDTNGVLLVPAEANLDTHKIDLPKQTWRQVSARIDPQRRWWVGVWNDDRPKPGDLARTKMIDGELLVLADEQSWIVPRAKQYVESDGRIQWVTSLPRRVDLTDDGDFVYGSVLPRYERLFSGALAFEDARQKAAGDAVEGESTSFTFANLSEIAADALAINYRVSLAELMLLGAWADETPAEIMRIVCNERDYALLIKKKLADLVGGSSSNGQDPETPGENTPTTGLTSPTSEPTRSGYIARARK